jgi:hypothetical protein
MSTDPTPNPGPSPQSPLQEWWQKLGSSGKLLAGGGLAGLISAFLPLFSVSGNFGGMNIGGTSMVIDAWQGKVGLISSIAALVLSWVVYQSKGVSKNLVWAVVGVGAVMALMAVWILINALRAGSSMNFGDVRMSAGPGIGSFTNAAAGLAAAAGAFLKAREEKLL